MLVNLGVERKLGCPGTHLRWSGLRRRPPLRAEQKTGREHTGSRMLIVSRLFLASPGRQWGSSQQDALTHGHRLLKQSLSSGLEEVKKNFKVEGVGG